MSSAGESVYFSRVRTEIMPLLPATPGRYLEVGCGTGATLMHIRDQGLSTWSGGIELGVEPASRAATQLDMVLQGDVETMDLPIAPESLDVILCLDVLEHLRDPWAMVVRLGGLLKPGGVMITSLPNIRNYKIVMALLFRGEWAYEDAGILDRTHLRFFVRDTAIELMQTGGLKVEAVLPHRIKRWKLKWILNKLLFGALTDHLAEQFLLRARRPDIMTMEAALPPEITDASAWYGPDMLRDASWLGHFTGAELAEVEVALKPLAADTAFNAARMTPADFPLPTLGPRLAALRGEILDGRGFALLRGLPVQHWSLREAAIAFLGIGSHLGSARSQNARGHVLGHVKDMGLSSDDPNVRIYQTHERQTFHTDSCDIVGLLCLQTAKSGGHSALVSSVTIFNEMRRHRPDLLALLFDPIETDRRGEVPVGEKPYFTIPTYNWHQGHLSAIYQRQYIESARRFDDVAPLTPAQVEAYDLFDALSNDPALNFHMELQPGDVQLVHNHTLLHDRTAFEDWTDTAKRRHLLRLWLAPKEARPLPPAFAQRYGSITPGDRGGIIVPGTQLTVPYEAV